MPALLDANAAYQAEHAAAAPRTSEPARRLVILTCMDTRIDPLRAFGLRLGDAHVLRNAGGRATADVIRSLIVSTHLLGTREIGVVHHTACGMEGVTDEDLATRTGIEGVEFLAFESARTSVIDDVASIRGCGHLPDDVVVWGAVFDVGTGALDVVTEPS